MNNEDSRGLAVNMQKKTMVLSIAMAVGAFSSTHLQAQGSVKALEEVVVTAQKREQSLQDVPSTVNVLNAQALSASTITEVNQLSNITPGIFINSDQVGRNTKIKIRGVGPDEGSNIRPSIGFFYNDIPLMTQLQGGQSVASDLDLGDLTRVEILKGPQSTLFGESVSAGAIAFYNQRPQLDKGWNGKFSVNYGSHDNQQYRGALGGDVSNTMAFRIAAYDNQVEDQVKNTVDNSRRKLESNGFSAQLLYEPIDSLRMILEYNRRNSSQAGGAVDGLDIISYGVQTITEAENKGIKLTSADPFDRKVQMLFPLTEKMRNELVSLHIDYDISENWSLTSISAHQMNQDKYGGSALLGGYNASNGVVEGFYAQGDQEIDYTTSELRLNYDSQNFTSMSGIFVSRYDSPGTRGDFGYVFPGFVFPLAQYIEIEKDMYSLFTHNSWHFAPKWELIAGARYTSEKGDGRNSLENFQGIYSEQPLDTSVFDKSSSKESAWGGTLKVLYNLDDDIVLYAGVDRGFRLGGVNNLGEPNYDTEIAVSYEAGLKGYLFDRTLRLGASIYHTDYDGYQAVLYNSEAFSFITQNAEVTGQGVELEVLWMATNNLELAVNALYNEVEYDKYLGATCDNYQLAFGTCPNNPVEGAQDLSGRELPASPKWSGNIALQYEDDAMDGYFTWYLRGEYAYRGNSYAHSVGLGGDPMQVIESYGLFNASLGFDFPGGWSLKLWGKNLADKDYFTDIARQPVGTEPGYIQARIGWERSYGATLGYEF